MAFIELHSSSKWALPELGPREAELGITTAGDIVKKTKVVLEAVGGAAEVGTRWVCCEEGSIKMVRNCDGRG